jgi:hypothetical protein
MANEIELVVDENITAIAQFNPITDITVVADPKVRTFNALANQILQGASISDVVPNALATWRTSNPSVVTVSGPTATPLGTSATGYAVLTELTSVGLGRATVTVTYQGKSDTVVVTVGTPYRICENATERFTFDALPPTGYTASTDTNPGVCYALPASWRQCEQTNTTAGSPPTNYTKTTDERGECYNPPVSWRQCGQPTSTLGRAPTDYTEAKDDNPGACYNPPSWRQCERSDTTVGRVPDGFVLSTDPSGVCYTNLHTATLTASPAEGGTVSGTSDLTPTPNTVVRTRINRPTQFNATANVGYTFNGWYLNGTLWSTNNSPSIFAERNATYEARFAKNPKDDDCRCYFVEPTVTGTSFEVTYRPCTARSSRTTQTFTSFTNICSADVPTRGRNAQIPQNLDTPCSSGQTCGTPVTWRECGQPAILLGSPPSTHELSNDTRGACYILRTGNPPPSAAPPSPPSPTPPRPPVITFVPALNTGLTFQYQRGSTQYPTSQVITATNTSTVVSCELQITTNSNIIVTPNKFIVLPGNSTQFTIQVTSNLLNQLQDGTSGLQMSIDIREL